MWVASAAVVSSTWTAYLRLRRAPAAAVVPLGASLRGAMPTPAALAVLLVVVVVVKRV
jgi:hypothetical protein